MLLGVIVAGYVWPSFGRLVNEVVGEDVLPIRDETPVNAPAEDEVAVVDVASLPDTPGSFSTAKRLLYEEVYAGHATTFYCGCAYYSTGRVNRSSCGYEVRSNRERASRIEAEHVFPAYHFGQHRPCWRDDLCTKSDGTAFGGRACCEDIDEVFQRAHNDLHNLVPAVGEVNGDRSNLTWGMIEGEPRAYGACNFEVDTSIRRAEPPEERMGDIARIYFYMSDTYAIRLSDQDRQLFEAWHRMDPVDDWERERNERIFRIQGNRNPYVR